MTNKINEVEHCHDLQVIMQSLKEKSIHSQFFLSILQLNVNIPFIDIMICVGILKYIYSNSSLRYAL